MDQQSFTVGQVARLARVTVRTLHHYDEIGLLPPSGRAANGYRTYTADDLARLQRVRSWRELGIGLEQVAELMGSDDPRTQLRRQHDLLQQRIERLQVIAATLRRTMEAHAMGIDLTPEEMFEAFGDFDPTEHAAEAEQRWGDTDAYQESARRSSTYTKDDWVRVRQEMDQVNTDFVSAMARGLPPDSEPARAAAAAHRAHIERWFYPVSPAMHRGLAEMYVADPRFTATYEGMAPGLTTYLHDSVQALYSSAGS